MNPRAKSVSCVSDTVLEITFLNGEVKLFDVQPYLSYPVYQRLKDKEFFQKAHIVNGIVAWDNEIDFDPDTLYIEGKVATLNSNP